MLHLPEAAEGSTLLVLFRERHISKLIQVNLERQGFKVLVAESENQAIWHLQEQKAAMLIIDGDLEVEQIWANLRSIPGCEDLKVLPVPRRHT